MVELNLKKIDRIKRAWPNQTLCEIKRAWPNQTLREMYFENLDTLR